MQQSLFKSLLCKDIAYFDTHKIGELSSLLTDNVSKIRDGIGDKLGPPIDLLSTLITSIVIGRVFATTLI